MNQAGGAMKLFKTKLWSVVDIGSLKLCCILLGMIAGAYLPDFVKRYVWLLAAAAILAAIKPTLNYFGKDKV